MVLWKYFSQAAQPPPLICTFKMFKSAYGITQTVTEIQCGMYCILILGCEFRNGRTPMALK